VIRADMPLKLAHYRLCLSQAAGIAGKSNRPCVAGAISTALVDVWRRSLVGQQGRAGDVPGRG
jgi:hypothetical protein